jgi:hypothetical protein
MKKNPMMSLLATLLVASFVSTSCKDSEPEPIPVTSVTFAATPGNLEIGGTFTFTANVLPENADDKTVAWASSNTAVATVAAGVVTAVGQGKTTISATANDGSGKKAEFEVTVNPAPVVEITGNVGQPVEIKASAAGTVPVKVAIEATLGIENFKVTITSSSQVFTGALAGLGLATEFDLANPGDLGQVLTGVNLINGADVKDKTDLEFDITTFIPMIFAVRAEAGETGDCTAAFKLAVTDKAGTTKEATISLDLVDDLYVAITGDGLGEERMEIKASEALGETPVPVVVNVAAPQGIESFKVEITSSSPVFTGALAGFGLATEFDLANPGDLGQVLTGVNLINGADVKGKTDLAFDITSFIPMIFAVRATAAETGDCTVDFKLTVTDTKEKSATATVKLQLVND